MKAIVQLGGRIARSVRAAVDGMPVEVVELPTSGPIPTGADFGPGDVLFLPATGSAQVAELADRGIDWMHIAGTGVDYFPLDQAPRATITCARGAWSSGK